MKLFSWLKALRNRGVRRGLTGGTSSAVRSSSWVVSPSGHGHSPDLAQGIENLEDRALLAVMAMNVGTVLTITMDAAADTATITDDGVNIEVNGTAVDLIANLQGGVNASGDANINQTVIFNTTNLGGTVLVAGSVENTTISANPSVTTATINSGIISISADVTTTSTQTYTGAVTLSGGTRTLTGSTVNNGSTLDGGAAGLIITGNADIDGALTNLTTVSVSGTSNIGANVTSTSTQTYTGAVTLSSNVVAGAGSHVLFSSTISTAGFNFSLNAGSTGNITFSAALTGGGNLTIVDGAVQSYQALTVNRLDIQDATTSVTFNVATSITTSVSVVSGGTIDVKAKMTAGTTVVLDAADNITIDGAIDPTTVTLTSDDDVILNATVDATTSITVTSGQDGTGTINGSGVLTAPTIDLNAATGIGNTTPLELAGSTITADSSTSGNVNIDNALAGAVTVTTLTTAGGGTILFENFGAGGVSFGTVSTTADGSPTAGEDNVTLSSAGGNLTITTSVTAGGVGDVVLNTTTSGNVILTGTTTASADDVTINSVGNISGTGLVTAGPVVLNATAGTIGTSIASPVRFAAASIETNTSAGGNQFISEFDSVSVGANDLNAGAGTITLSGGTFLATVSGSILSPLVVASGATVGGTGTTGTITTLSGGNVAPGSSPGVLNSGNVTLVSGSNYKVDIDGLAGAGAVSGHDQLNVTGAVSLGGSNLVVTLGGGYMPHVGDLFVIVNNDLSDPVLGTFKINGNPVADDGVFQVGSQGFVIDYTGGVDGNDVTLRPIVLIVLPDTPNTVTVLRVGTEVVVKLGKTVFFHVPVADLPGELRIEGGSQADRITLEESLNNFYAGVVIVNGNGGNDSLNANRSKLGVIFTGGDGNDVLAGGSGDDSLDGGAGNDNITSGGGNDTVHGDAGNDRLDSGSGNDQVHGGDGNDVINGGSGNDLMFGDAGNDALGSGSGNDLQVGGAGNDVLTGGSGRSLLIGGVGSDKLTGGSVDDIVIAGNTDFDDITVAANLTELINILATWIGPGSYLDRVTTLRTTLQAGVTVHDDTPSTDILKGGSGQDWFFARTFPAKRDSVLARITVPTKLEEALDEI